MGEEMLKSITREAQFLSIHRRSVSLQAKLPKSPHLVPQVSKLLIKVHHRPALETNNTQNN